MTDPRPDHFNYQALDKLLNQVYDPEEIANLFDEIMNDLVDYADKDVNYHPHLCPRYTLLRYARDIFKNLKRVR